MKMKTEMTMDRFCDVLDKIKLDVDHSEAQDMFDALEFCNTIRIGLGDFLKFSVSSRTQLWFIINEKINSIRMII